jgi:hypothetical protein
MAWHVATIVLDRRASVRGTGYPVVPSLRERTPLHIGAGNNFADLFTRRRVVTCITSTYLRNPR